MAEGVTQEQFYIALQTLEKRLGEKIDWWGERHDKKLAEHEKEDQAVANRVLIIETQREEEREAAVRRGTWAGIFAAGGVTGVIEAVRHFWK
jgi:hypothetical protein